MGISAQFAVGGTAKVADTDSLAGMTCLPCVSKPTLRSHIEIYVNMDIYEIYARAAPNFLIWQKGISMAKRKIGIYGSNVIESEKAVQLAWELGKVLARNGVIVVTGGCSGMPYAVAQAAKQGGASVWGFTPEHDEEEQKRAYPLDDINIYDKLFYVPQQYDQFFYLDHALSASRDQSARLKYRNVVSTIHVDAGVIVAGGWGTLNEFTNLIYDGKPIGVLRGTGGLADELPEWYPRLRKKSGSVVHFSDSPTELVNALMEELASLS
jgi:predicted Rossmann-fold nucleotide-binding protein